MKLVAIVAVAENGVIGREGQLPWRLPADLRWFKENTLGKPVLMGRKTFESIGRPLPGRRNVVLTRGPAPEGTEAAASLEEALALPGMADAEEVMIIGGAQIYRAAWDRLDELWITRVHHSFEGDAFFHFDPEGWCRTFREHHEADEANPFAYTFERWVREPALSS